MWRLATDAVDLKLNLLRGLKFTNSSVRLVDHFSVSATLPETQQGFLCFVLLKDTACPRAAERQGLIELQTERQPGEIK